MVKHICKVLYALFLLCTIVLFSQSTQASHSMGADLTYTCIGPNTYKVRLSFYRDCYGVSEPTDAIISISSASCGQSFSVTAYKIPGTGQEITPICPSETTTCNGGIYTGVEEWIYEGTVILPMQCTDWVFSFSLCCRNAAITTINNPGNNDFYIYATLNNTISPCNNSPTFSNKPVPFVCIGQQFCFNHGAYDADGDSLVYSLITPLQTASNPVIYNGGFSASQPVSSSPAMLFSTNNGNICMTPQQLEITVMAVLVEEYRNGVLIGSVVRDIQLTVINCSNNLPTLSGINGTSAITQTICANEPFCFDVISSDSDPGQNVTINYDQSIPGASFSNNGLQPPTGTFCWTPSVAQISPTPHCFTITVKDNACPYYGYQVYSYCLTVTGVNANAGPDQYLGCDVSTSILANGSGGSPPYSYLWSTGSSDQNITVGPGTYILTVSDGLCSNQDTITVSNAPLPTVSAVPVGVSCNAGNDGSITVNPNGGTGPMQFSIDNGTTYQPTGTFSNLTAGNYNILIQDANGCTATTTTVINEPTPLVVIPSSMVSTCSNANGSVSITASGGTGSIQYSIDNGTTYQSSSTFPGLPTGNYNIMIQDANGCTATSLIAVTDEPSPTITSTPVINVSCNAGSDGSIAINPSGGTGAIQYSIDNGTTFQSTGTFSNLSAGNYNLLIQDANGCTATTTATITEPVELSLTTNTVAATCGSTNGSINVTGNGGTGILEYSNDNGSTFNVSNVFTGLAAGNYNIAIQDQNGCQLFAVASVSNALSPIINSTPVNHVTCYNGTNGSVTVNASGGTGSLEYSADNGISFQSGNSFTGLSAGVYNLVVQDNNGCITTSSAVINEPDAVAFSNQTVTSTCSGNNGSVTINAIGGSGTYQYSIDNGITFQPLNTFNNLYSGVYNIIVIDVNGCSLSGNINIPDAPSPIILSLGTSDLTCFGSDNGIININAVGGSGILLYSIDGGSTYDPMNNFMNLPVGNYQISVTDTNGCVADSSISLSQPDAINFNTTTTDASCGNNDGTLTINASGGTGVLQFSIDSGMTYQSVSSFNNLLAGTYQVTVIDDNGCQLFQPASVNNAAAPVINSVPVINLICNSINNGSLIVNASGGTGTLSYSIDNGFTFQSTNSFNNLSAGTYNVIVQDINGCEASSVILITEPDPLTFIANPVTATCSNSNGSISIIANGGTGAHQFSIDGGVSFQNTGAFNNLMNGNYSIVVQDANGCSVTGSTNVLNAPSPVISSVSSTDLTCYGIDNGMILFTAINGTGVLHYSIDGGLSFQLSGNFDSLSIGNYNLVVTDDNGCTVDTIVEIEQPDQIIANASTTQSTCGNSNGGMTLSVTGGTGGYQFSIDSGATFQTSNQFFGLTSGSYGLIIQDGAGCISNLPVAISNAAAPVISSVNVTNASCYGLTDGSILIIANGGTGSLQYSINNGITFQATNQFLNLNAGNYNIVVEDANGCQAASTELLSEPPQIFITTSSMSSSCGNADGSVTVNATGGTGTLQFSADSGVTFNSTGLFLSLGAGNYDVIVLDAIGCTENTVASVNNLNGPVISNVDINHLDCYGSNNGTIQIFAAGGSGIINYSINNGTTYQLTDSFSNLPGGTYSILVSDSNNCIASSSVLILEPPLLVLNTVVDDATCGFNNGSLTLYASGGTGSLQYSIDSGATFYSTTSFTGLANSNYSLVVLDSNNCSASAMAFVNDLAGPVIAGDSVVDVSCYGGNNGTINLQITGGTIPINYQWSNTAGTQNISGLIAGNYTVTITDANSCIASQVFLVEQPPVLSAITNPVHVTCYAGINGSLGIVASGGTGPYSYLWSDGSTDSLLTNLSVGNYSVTVTDSLGCILNISDSISSPPIIAIGSTTTDVTCYGSNDGSVQTAVNGGVSPYTYLWSNGITTPSISNLSGGLYKVTVTDNNNCNRQKVLLVDEPDPLLLSTYGSDTICIGQSVIISSLATGGVTPYNYVWSNGVLINSQSVHPVATTIYLAGVADANGCTVQPQPVSVYVNPPLTVAVSPDSAVCEGESLILSASASGGNGGPYNFLWINNLGNNASVMVTPDSTTTYIISITDNCGTPGVSAQTNVVVHPRPVVAFVPDPPKGCVPLEVNFQSFTTTVAGSDYKWTFGDGSGDSLNINPVHIYNEPGWYDVSLMVTTPFGCTRSLTLNDAVQVYSLPVADFIANPPITTILNPRIEFVDISNDASYWNWDFGDANGSSIDRNPVYTYRDTGTYEVVLYIENSYGCADTAFGKIIIEGDYTLYIPNAFTPNGDGINEIFSPQGIGITDIDFMIFNRWGQKVFQSSSIQNGWNGKHILDNSNCAQGVYVYLVKAVDHEGNGHEYSGRVSLIR